eukprot:12821299-Prorocentrum_lima.AAC.1
MERRDLTISRLLLEIIRLGEAQVALSQQNRDLEAALLNPYVPLPARLEAATAAAEMASSSTGPQEASAPST